jgi:hypothetical protein
MTILSALSPDRGTTYEIGHGRPNIPSSNALRTGARFKLAVDHGASHAG